MSFKRYKVGKPEEVRRLRQEVETVQICDCCGREMPAGVYPRFGLEIEEREQCGPDDDTSRRALDLCSAECIVAAARDAPASAEWPADRFTGAEESPDPPWWRRESVVYLDPKEGAEVKK